MDELQTHYDCCGKTSSNDYVLMDKPIPVSCYLNQDTSDIHNLFTVGCSEKMVKYYEEESYRFAILSWICVAFEVTFVVNKNYTYVYKLIFLLQ